MALLPVEKIRLYIHRDDASEALEFLQEKGVVELTKIPSRLAKKLQEKRKRVFEFHYVSARLDFAVELLSRYRAEKKTLKTLLEGDKVRVKENAIPALLQKIHAQEIVDRLEDLERKVNLIEEKMKNLRQERSLLLPWKNLPLRLGKTLETKQTRSLFLVWKEKKLREDEQSPFYLLARELQKKNLVHAIEKVDFSHGVLTYWIPQEEEVQQLLQKYHLERVDIPLRRGTPKEELERINRALRNNRKRKEVFEGEIRSFTKYLDIFRVAADVMYWKRQKHNVLTSGYRTKNVHVYEGWCPQEAFQDLQKGLEKIAPSSAIEKIPLQKGEEPPVILKNKPLFQPFEIVTRLYGMPSPKDLDPTVFLAGFFFLFFGLSLSDAVYGLILVALTGYLLWKFRLPKETAILLKALFYGGIATFFVGLLFGGYLGIDPAKLPGWMQKFQQFDPLANPLPVLFLSLGLGYIQIVFGVMLKWYNTKRLQGWKEALITEGPWLFFFTALVLWAAENLHLLAVPGGGGRLVLLSLAILVLAGMHGQKNLFAGFFKGLGNLYGIVGYFSDVLSYSRLLALGLATSALAFAINLIAGIVKDLIPVVGPLVALLVLVGGHAFNLIINTLGAFIHSARLQFVEFFGKFFEGGGREFHPFQRQGRYVLLEKEDG